MSNDRIIPYVVEMAALTATGSHSYSPCEWRTRARNNVPGYGRPTASNLAAHIKGFEDSTSATGCNSHLGVTVVTSARIRDQRSGEILATYRGPSFVAF